MTASAVLAMTGLTALAGEPEPPMADGLKNLPVNKWIKLPGSRINHNAET